MNISHNLLLAFAGTVIIAVSIASWIGYEVGFANGQEKGKGSAQKEGIRPGGDSVPQKRDTVIVAEKQSLDTLPKASIPARPEANEIDPISKHKTKKKTFFVGTVADTVQRTLTGLDLPEN